MRILKVVPIPLTLPSPHWGEGVRSTGEGGFTYLEIIAGILIIIFILFGMNAVFGVGMRSNKKAERIQRALGLAQDLMEKAIARRFLDDWTITETVDEFTRKLEVGRREVRRPDGVLLGIKKCITVTVKGPDMRAVTLYCETADLRLL